MEVDVRNETIVKHKIVLGNANILENCKKMQSNQFWQNETEYYSICSIKTGGNIDKLLLHAQVSWKQK
jgi:hypothetical protein